MKSLKKILLISMSLILVIALVGCSGKSSDDTNKSNEQVESTDSTDKNESNTEEEVESKDEDETSENTDNPIATIKIKGYDTITAELYPDKAPNSVANFIELANSKFYDGLIFHRVIEGFMNQGGDPEGTGMGGPGYAIEGEFASNGFTQNDIDHEAGVLSMARSGDPNSAGSQFFLMAEEASHLNGDYAAFGKVIEGLDVVSEINKVDTDLGDRPKEDIVIEEIRVDTKGVTYPEVEKVDK